MINIDLLRKYIINNDKIQNLNKSVLQNQTDMKSKHLKQRQGNSKPKSNQPNYPSLKDNQNNQKLSNLLNLSQINIKSNNFTPDFHNSTIFSDLQHNQAHIRNNIIKNFVPSNKNNHSHSNLNSKLNSGLLFQINQCSKNNDNGQGSPQKNFKNPKSKRCKSNKKNLLSCQQILDITRKRDTYSVVPFESSKNNTIIYAKSKKKGKKQNPLTNNQIKNAHTLKIHENGGKNCQQFCSLNNSKTITHLGAQNNSNFVINYPLSMSHSFIVFSDKDSTMNNTTKILSKKLSVSAQNKLFQLQGKLQKIKIEHAAIIIQKNWRGYLTRKLLQDYIKNQQQRLLDKLTNIKEQKIEFEKFSRLSPGCNNFWTNEADYCPEVSGIFENQSQIKINNEQVEFSQEVIDSGNKNKVNSENRNNKTIKSYEQSDEEHYPKKSPVINGDFIQNQVLESIQLFERSICVTNRNLDYQVNMEESKKYCIKSTNLHLQEKSIHTQHSSRNVIKCHKKLLISKQFQHIIQPSSFFKGITSRNLNLSEEFISFQATVNEIFKEKIEKYKKYLTEQVKKSLIQFNTMLQTRQHFNEITRLLNQKTSQFQKSISSLLMQIPNPEQKMVNEGNLENKKFSKIQIPVLKLENTNIEKNFERKDSSQQEQQQQQQQQEQILSSVKKIINPQSEYFTIELPTEELSPHKKPISSGLQSLRTYFYNLNQEYLEQLENENETKFLCKVLKKHSEMGPQNMVQRCLIQMLVQMLTCQYSLQEVLMTIQSFTNGTENNEQNNEQNILGSFVRKWTDELDKWQLGPIQEVSGNMQESADVTERNHTSKKKKLGIELHHQYFQIE